MVWRFGLGFSSGESGFRVPRSVFFCLDLEELSSRDDEALHRWRYGVKETRSMLVFRWLWGRSRFRSDEVLRRRRVQTKESVELRSALDVFR